MSQACMVAAKIEQRLGRLTGKNLLGDNKMMRDMARMRPCLTFRRPEVVRSISAPMLSNASHGGNEMDYGHIGLILGL